jgi:WD40 repeat protein
MRLPAILAIALPLPALHASAQTDTAVAPTSRAPTPFPPAEFVLRDVIHKEQKSGVQFQGGQLTIASGVGTPTVINSLSFSSDGKILVAGKDFGRAVLWDVQGKKFLRAIDTSQGQVQSVVVSPDGRVVATGGTQDGNSVKLWDVTSGKTLWRFTQAKANIIQLLFAAQGKRLIVSDNASNTYLLDAVDGKLIYAFPSLRVVAVSSNGESMTTVDGTEVAEWDVSTKTKSQSTSLPNKFSMLLTANVSADRFAIFEKRVVKIGQLSTGKMVLDLPDLVSKNFTWRPDFAAFSPGGAIAYLSIDSRLRVLDARTGTVCSGPTMYSGAAALSSDGRWFAGAKDDSILSQERTDGVWIWSAKSLLQKCELDDTSP